MFKKLEVWLRKIVAEEVAKVEVSLQREKAALSSLFDDIKAHTQAFDESVSHRSDLSRLAEENASLKDTVSKLTCWQATPEEVVADHKLKIQK